MKIETEIRESNGSDNDALMGMYPRAFPQEDLRPVLSDLLDAERDVLSLVAICDGIVVGHIAFSMCGIDGQNAQVALLAPLAVDPDVQKQGIGRGLISAGFERMKALGVIHVCVLGDPGYYSRFDFKTERNIAPPYDIPVEWEAGWQSVKLNDGAPVVTGRLSVPPFWQHPHLWLP